MLIVIVAVGVAVFRMGALASGPTTAVSTGTPGYDRARTLLAALPVKGWDRHSDFSRYRFGEPWSDDVEVEFGHNGCNTRDDILRRDLRELVVRPGSSGPQDRRAATNGPLAAARGPSALACSSIRL